MSTGDADAPQAAAAARHVVQQCAAVTGARMCDANQPCRAAANTAARGANAGANTAERCVLARYTARLSVLAANTGLQYSVLAVVLPTS